MRFYFVVFLTVSALPEILLAQAKPNILWVTSEDNGPEIGCFGDSYATTPNLDRLAKKGFRYLNFWSNAPVCAPARTTIISGVYPMSTGSQHMRSMTTLASHMKMYPQFLRESGYYCTNNSKEDYNLAKPGQVWDESSRTGHWKKRAPGQSFFAIFNHTVSHESQIRKRPHKPVHDPAGVRVPAYHPDTPQVRQDWAQYYDKITEMDIRVGKNLDELEEAGLAEDTIVLYYGDHGSGMPRSKRWPYNSGLSVPLIVYIPEKYAQLRPPEYRPGGSSDRMVSFVDLAPTLLSLVGIKPPEYFQGHAFAGQHQAPEQQYSFGFRGRMDERYDMVRSIRDKRYIYIRNYMPHKIYGQFIAYMFQTPTTQVWKNLYDQGKLKPPQTYFWEAKAPEELYDLAKDPDEVDNLAGSPEHQETLTRFREVHRDFTVRIRDLGFLPESEIHTRAVDSTPYDVGRDRARYPVKRIQATAEMASSLDKAVTATLVASLDDSDSAVRYWAAQGLLMRRRAGVSAGLEQLVKARRDSSPSVQIIAAQALAQFGPNDELEESLVVLLRNANIENQGVYISMLALNAIDELDERAASIVAELRELPNRAAATPGRMRGYVPNLIRKTLADLEASN